MSDKNLNLLIDCDITWHQLLPLSRSTDAVSLMLEVKRWQFLQWKRGAIFPPCCKDCKMSTMLQGLQNVAISLSRVASFKYEHIVSTVFRSCHLNRWFANLGPILLTFWVLVSTPCMNIPSHTYIYIKRWCNISWGLPNVAISPEFCQMFPATLIYIKRWCNISTLISKWKKNSAWWNVDLQVAKVCKAKLSETPAWQNVSTLCLLVESGFQKLSGIEMLKSFLCQHQVHEHS